MTGGVSFDRTILHLVSVYVVSFEELSGILRSGGVFMNVFFYGVHPFADMRNTKIPFFLGIFRLLWMSGSGIDRIIGRIKL